MKNFLRNFMPLFAFTMAIILCFTLIGCTDNKEKTVQEQFAEYYNLDKHWKIDLDEELSVELSRIEKASDYKATYFWIDVNYDDENNNGFERLYSWINSSNAQKRNDLKSIGDMFIEFAKSQKINNNFDLFVTFSYEALSDTQVIYNYETGELHTPKVDNIFIEMYEQFNTCYSSEVEKMQGGTDWLVAKGLGEYKHGKYEKDFSALKSMTIWCYNGQIQINDQDKSNHYSLTYNP